MSGGDVTVHPSASVHTEAKLESGVWIGPGCVIGPRVTIRRNTRLEAHIVLDGWAEIGSDCRFSPFAAVGGEPQDVGYQGEETRIEIGDRNVFREFVTVHRATTKQDRLTRVGNDNYFMAYSHVAHDCAVGNRTIFLHAATLGGHVTVGDFATVGALSAVHQFCRIGRFAFMGGGTLVTQDVLPFARVVGQRPTRVLGLNVIGLRRNGFSNARIAALQAMFKIFFFSDLNTRQALERLRAEIPDGEDRDEIIRFIESSKRGLIKKAAESWERD